MAMRMYTTDDMLLGINLDMVTGYVVDEDDEARVWTKDTDHEHPFEINGEENVTEFLDQLSRAQRQAWTSANGALTLVLSDIQGIKLSDKYAYVYMKGEMQTYWTVAKSDGQSLRDAWVEHLTWS